ncbi:hypothetical protein Tco_0882675 [Tanacetum coccineum]
MPCDCFEIIESKSKVRNSRNKAVVAKVRSNLSTPGISPDVAALTTEVSKLKNMMKTMLIEKQKAQAPAPIKEAKDRHVARHTCKDLTNAEQVPLIGFLSPTRSHRPWKLSDIKGNRPGFVHQILIDEDYAPRVQHQRKVKPVHCVRNKVGMTVVKKADNESKPASMVTGHAKPSSDKLETPRNSREHFSPNLGIPVALRVDSTLWFADLAKLHAGKFIVNGIVNPSTRTNFFKDVKTLLPGDPLLVQNLWVQNDSVVCARQEALDILEACHMDQGDYGAQSHATQRTLMPDPFWPTFTKMAHELVKNCDIVAHDTKISQG